MKKLFVSLSGFLVTTAILAAQTNELALIPLPQKVQLSSGAYRLNSKTQVLTDADSGPTADLFISRVRHSTGFDLRSSSNASSDEPVGNAILLTTKNADSNLGPEGYELSVTTNSVVIRAPAQAGIFYGLQTLLQLLPPEIFSSNIISDVNWRIPCVEISDTPRFPWRGLMLDVSRHFYNKTEVEKVIDTMALYKLNTFHWHLVDDQGWRIQIKKYPRLTKIGAWRPMTKLVPANTTAEKMESGNAHPGWKEPSRDKFRKDGSYGGFYTQADIREVVAYAGARHITVVPEIELPGHSVAALAAYPQFGCANAHFAMTNVAGVNRGVYSAAKDETFQFLDDVLSEVFSLFPGKYVHIGGDEVPSKPWLDDAACKALMEREGLTNTDQLESFFIRRIEKFVNAHGKTLIGWSEIAHGGLATNAVVMDWIGGGLEAASAGHQAVMTPTGFCYLDHYQSTNHSTEPHAIGGFLPLNKIYSFEPVPEKLPEQFRKNILGAQGNLWTEYVASVAHVEYMIFPRACALAEVTWSAKDARNWPDFQQRLQIDLQRLDALGINYRRGKMDPAN